MYTEMSLKEALKYFMKGRKVLVLNEYDDKSISTVLVWILDGMKMTERTINSIREMKRKPMQVIAWL